MAHTATEPGTAQSPFLTRYAAERTPSPEMQGYYSPEAGMWVVSENGLEKPLIDHARDAVELETFTKAQGESDDVTNLSSMTELATKTCTRPEQDDEGIFSGLEMVTTTEEQRETDDISLDVTGLFLQ